MEDYQHDPKKIVMSSNGTESILWHMMNDMHLAMMTEQQDPSCTKNIKDHQQVNNEDDDLESLRDQEKLFEKRTFESRIRLVIGILLILLVLFFTIFVSEMKKKQQQQQQQEPHHP
ncbi:hypothetical protein BDA99DRAFT_560473 [Phascolomyces articulosus]|uniref:Uncharacterized protein n=1 Tax=Phascolomyces articulosus TaxID=60185 RepID=A0AAD5JZ46_9FUNG|nr:hypothetical protein BDA99DRAFT_560473 [Phascolomyces articulosus]